MECDTGGSTRTAGDRFGGGGTAVGGPKAWGTINDSLQRETIISS